ncbi:MAG TPA: NADH-quinone oxidoreductase subunit N [Candidatus Dormibacteraeota bacterium]|nr:NADH-quinone oxidoreductase subunit N [Candidatus Dormibacteraeota bacterium]
MFHFASYLSSAPPWFPLHFVPAGDLLGVLPILIVGAGVVLVLLADLAVPRRGNRVLPAVTGIVLLGALGTAVGQWVVNAAHPIVFNGAYANDRFALFADFVVLLTALAVVVLSPGYLRRRGMEEGEYYILLLASVTGMLVLDGALNLIVVFLGIELLSIPLYVLAGFARDEPLPQEAAMKYLLLGGFASGFLVYGMALIYGETGHTGLVAIHHVLTQTALSHQFDPLLLAGIALLAVGLAFKVSAAPFHWWTPDVYQGSPALVTTFMSVATKVAAFAVFLRLFSATLAPYRSAWQIPIAVVAIISMVFGNVVAVAQTSVKRLLAYSGIAQAGYIMIGVAVGRPDGTQASLYYLAAYAFMNTGAFAVVTVLSRRGEDCDRYSQLAGLSRRQPLLAGLMAIFMLSLAGFPLTVGFFGKFFLFSAAIHDGQLPLAIWGILTSAVSLFYYLRVILVMFTGVPAVDQQEEETIRVAGVSMDGAVVAAKAPAATGGVPATVVIVLAGVGTLVLGIFPALIYTLLQGIAVVHG